MGEEIIAGMVGELAEGTEEEIVVVVGVRERSSYERHVMVA